MAPHSFASVFFPQFPSLDAAGLAWSPSVSFSRRLGLSGSALSFVHLRFFFQCFSASFSMLFASRNLVAVGGFAGASASLSVRECSRCALSGALGSASLLLWFRIVVWYGLWSVRRTVGLPFVLCFALYFHPPSVLFPALPVLLLSWFCLAAPVAKRLPLLFVSLCLPAVVPGISNSVRSVLFAKSLFSCPPQSLVPVALRGLSFSG